MKLALVGLVATAVCSEEPSIWSDLSKLNHQVPIKKFPKARFSGFSDVSTLQQRFMDAAISYCSRKRVFGIPCICNSSYKESEVIVNKQSKSVVVIAINQKTEHIVISYRPTMAWQNWVDNVAYSLVHMPNAPIGAQVHQGFYRYYNSTILESNACVRRLLRDTRYKSYPIQIVGYSLGAAVAIVSLPGWVKLLNTLGDNRGLEVIAYAGPRPGNEMLAEYLASFRVPITRYTNRNDIVSHLPPRSLGFVHVGHEIYEKEEKDGKSTYINCNDHFDEDPACSYGTEGSYSARRHMLPFNKFVPLPPFCME